MLDCTVLARRRSFSCSSSGRDSARSASVNCPMITLTRSVSAGVTPPASIAVTRRLPRAAPPGEFRRVFGVGAGRAVEFGPPVIEFALVEPPVVVEAFEPDRRELLQVLVLEGLRQLDDPGGQGVEFRAQLLARVLAFRARDDVLREALVHVGAHRDVAGGDRFRRGRLRRGLARALRSCSRRPAVPPGRWPARQLRKAGRAPRRGRGRRGVNCGRRSDRRHCGFPAGRNCRHCRTCASAVLRGLSPERWPGSGKMPHVPGTVPGPGRSALPAEVEIHRCTRCSRP